MSEGWLTKLEAIASDVATRGSQAFAQRELLFGLWLLFMDAPPKVRTYFEGLDESDLVRRGNTIGEQLLMDGFTPPAKAASPVESVAFAAGLLRGLEQAYVRGGAYMRAPRRAAELATSYGGVAGYVLPFAARFREAGKAWPPYFARRGLVMSRCLLAELATGHKIDLVIGDPARSPDQLRCVAAIFEVVVPLDAEGAPIDFTKGGKFIFHGATLKPADIEAAVADAMSGDEPADIIVFPELTMPPDQLKELVRALRRKIWSKGSAKPAPQLVIGGSWHLPVKPGVFLNRSPALRSNGQIIGWHEKHRPYTERALVEDIEVSDHILVVASPNLTVAIGICLDFCQEGEAGNAYSYLDVDLAVVASMGSETTIESHDRQAKRVWHMRKTATFIAQQSEKSPFGYVYATTDGGPGWERVHQQISRRKFVTKS